MGTQEGPYRGSLRRGFREGVFNNFFWVPDEELTGFLAL